MDLRCRRAEASRISQIGEFTLDREGTLEGDVREILSGHEAIRWRAAFASVGAAHQEEDLRKDLKARFPDANTTNINFSGTEDSALSVGFRYHIKAPGYAQRTGKRLLFVPNYFKIGNMALFPESKREYP